MTHRYHQAPLQVEGAQPRDYSPRVERPAPPAQGWLPFSDGGQLGPLFNTNTEEAQP
jgi:hypothetical protein